MAAIRAEEKINKEYLFYFLMHNENEITGNTGAVFNSINKKQIGDLKILMPATLPEQTQIVNTLDNAFQQIDRAKVNLEKNLHNAKELFQSKLNSYNYKKEELGNIVNIKTGKLNANAAVDTGEYNFFTCSRETFKIDTFAYDCEAILLAGNNAVGNFNVKHFKGKFNAYQRTYIITVKDEEKLNYRFLYFQMKSSLLELKKQSVGAGTKFLRLPVIKAFKIYYPSLKEQEEYVAEVDMLESELSLLQTHYQQKLNNLEELKKSILEKTFKGEL